MLHNRPRTINLYIGEYFNEVQQLANLNQDDGDGQTLTGVWLVQIAAPEYGKEERDIQSIFQFSPMRFDSLVFAFYKPDKGNLYILRQFTNHKVLILFNH